MKSLNTKVLTTYALFLAIMLIMAFVPGLGLSDKRCGDRHHSGSRYHCVLLSWV